jgi:hypothetical protein
LERPRNLDTHDLTGTEDIGPEDTFDGDYGRLLERVYMKEWRPQCLPVGTVSWNGYVGWNISAEHSLHWSSPARPCESSPSR